ncbi:MAG: DUF480 domain-containing protein [Planctomycetes bacterium]|nr:DUF480 domain-containing protein [Planctomycetota bacterium]
MNESESDIKWQTLERHDRRVVGVLVEKAKTTPDNYPLTLNSLLNGANQKSNRYPQMQLDEEHVFDALERLRKLGAVAEVQGDGRAPKFRHLLYDWLGVDKFELAVMAELLLRGAQTIGELRGRAARMEPIAGISELRPILDSLNGKGLLLYLTPPGRGCIVTHSLYQEQELEKLRAEHGNVHVEAPAPTAKPPTPSVASNTAPTDNNEIALLRAEVAALRKELKEMIWKIRVDVDELQSHVGMERD